jgi:hypothetical protein
MDVAVESRPRMRELGSPSRGRMRLTPWGAIHCDNDLMAAVAIVVAWRERAPTDEGARTEAILLRRDMQGGPVRCIGGRGRLRDCERGAVEPDTCTPEYAAGGGGDEETVVRVFESYREARRSLKRAIEESKKREWDELQATLDSDPWGRSYRVV